MCKSTIAQGLGIALLMMLATLAYAEGSPALSLAVEITGVKGELLTNVRQSLSVLNYTEQPPKNSTRIISESIIRRAHKRAEKEVQQALRPFGFYQATVISTLTKVDQRWSAVYQVKTGLPVKIGQVDINIEGSGKAERSLQLLLSQSPISVGKPLNHQDYTQYKQALYDTLFEQGYINAAYGKSELRVDIKRQLASVILQLNSGKKYYFGKLTIEQDVVNPELIESLITINESTPFNTDRLLALQLKLTDTGYFSQTDIQIQRDQVVDQRIPVTIIATPSKKLKYSTSAGFGTDTGPRVGASVLNRRVNRRGHHLQYGVRLSSVESNLNAKYTIPTGNISSEYFDFSAKANQEAINDTESTQYDIGVSLNQNRWGGRRQLSINLIQEEFSFDDEVNNTSLLLIPSLRYTRQKSDNSLFTRKGYSINADIRGGLKSALSETTFLHTRIAGRVVLPISPRSRFLTKVELGAISTDQFVDLPPSERFFTGGSQSVRGYGYKDIGPENSLSNNIGGKYLFASSVEIDYLPWGNSGFAAFYDAGDATSHSFSLKTAAGIGFRYRSPVGMIRIDLAHPFDDPNENYRLHISIGPDL